MNYINQAKVIEIIEHNEDIREYILVLDKERKYNPGSFVQLTLDLVTASDIWPDSRTFSIASYKNKEMHFIIKNVGDYTNRIFNELHKGDTCTIKYPYGDLFNKNFVSQKHLFIAGGLGITPFLGLIEYYKSIEMIDHITLLYSVKHSKDLLHYNNLKSCLGNHLKVFITREKIDKYYNRRICLEDIKNVSDKETNLYICGSKSFNNDIKKMLLNAGYTKVIMDEWD